MLALSGLNGRTDYSNGIVARTGAGGASIDLVLPERATLTFSAQPPKACYVGGDQFELTLASGVVQGAFVDAYHLLVEGACEFSETEHYETRRSGDRLLIAVAGRLDASLLDLDLEQLLQERKAWLGDVRLPGTCDRDVADAYVKAIVQARTSTLSAEGEFEGVWTTPDRWPHRDMWLWDSVFHAAGQAHLDADWARQTIEAVFATQEADGRVPHQSAPTGWRSTITQPPLLAFGMARVIETAAASTTTSLSDADAWIASRFDDLLNYLEWNERHRDTDGNGLLEWFIEADEHCRSGESGMDNSPRFDGATQLDAVDFNCFMALEYRTLADFAERLGRDAEARRCRGRWRELCELIESQLWDDEAEFYLDRDVVSGNRVPVLGVSGFLPLVCGAASPARARRLARHLRDPETFGTPVPIPSIARSTPCDRDRDDMWRGPMWVNLNWLVELGLREYGLDDDADRLRDKTMAELVRRHAEFGTFFEFYDSEGVVAPPSLWRKGECAGPDGNPFRRVIHDFGWSATLFIDMAVRAAEGADATDASSRSGGVKRPALLAASPA